MPDAAGVQLLVIYVQLTEGVAEALRVSVLDSCQSNISFT